MKLATIKTDSGYRLCVATDRGLIDIEKALAVKPADGTGRGIPTEMMELLRGGKDALKRLDAYVASLPTVADHRYLVAEETAEWAPCVPAPQKLICVGLNYRKHAEETNAAIPEYPILFNKFNNALAGHLSVVTIPATTKKLDYEAELAIVIGEKAQRVSKKDALGYVAGYAAANDLSARELQTRTSQWLLGKSGDGFCPLGPYLVTSDEVGDPNRLSIQTEVNGELRQNSNTSDMIFHCDEIVSYLSHHMTLESGDVILTGTPEGVVLGLPEDKQVYLQPDDEVKIRIEKLGTLSNRFTAAL
ncbi:fumarylacetoacetate hydrolase family protein [Paenibacillus sp. NPDC058071]|uniref:fumarylacetoacetate hydrolase family protein n=1 Tax=Paenibacillus sp. NPDC058071 TaxID=3346326 RepID=UPI0036DB9663